MKTELKIPASGYVGITANKDKWRARKKINGVTIIDQCGFDDTKQAAEAINKAIVDYNEKNNTTFKLLDIETKKFREKKEKNIPKNPSISGYVGVTLVNGKWMARRTIKNIVIINKAFDSQKEAALAINNAVTEYNNEKGTSYSLLTINEDDVKIVINKKPKKIVEKQEVKPVEENIDNEYNYDVLSHKEIKKRGIEILSLDEHKNIVKSRDHWQCTLKVNDERHKYTYVDFMHACFHRDLLIKKFGLEEERGLYNIPKPDGFILKVHHVKNSDLPVGIFQTKAGYYHEIRHLDSDIDVKHHKVFKNTVEEAIKSRNEYLHEIKMKKETAILNLPILRDNYGVAIIEIFNKNGIKVAETQVDDDLYYDILSHSWRLNEKVVGGYVNGESTTMPRFILKCNDPSKQVLHFDGNSLNNRRSNLFLHDH